MQHKAIVQRVAEARGGPTVQAEDAVEAILATIIEALRARVDQNSKTGVVAAIPARRVVRCVVSQTLKQAGAWGASTVNRLGRPASGTARR